MLAFALCGVLALAACGSSPSSAANTTPGAQQGTTATTGPTGGLPSFCTRISAATVSQAVGFNVSAPSLNFGSAGDETSGLCAYQSTATATPDNLEFADIVYESDSNASVGYDTAVSISQQTDPPVYQAVSGVGDKAFFANTSDTLFVLKGNLYFTVRQLLISGSDDEHLASAQQIATAFLAAS